MDKSTNFSKLVRWDADFYKSLSDDDCIVCLTEKQVYLLGQTLEQLRWPSTRWTGDKSEMDFDAIASQVEYRLEERMTCEQLTKILERIGQIERTLNDFVNPDDDFAIDETTVWDRYTPEEIANLTVSTATCTDDDKDKWYGGVKELVTYIHNVNKDALEQLSQAGNFADQTARLIAASPLGLLPFDEMTSIATFIVDELLEEYEATVDETLLQTVICDLFCIAINSGCTLAFSDVLSYFGSKVSGDFADLFVDIAQVVQFAITGTFSGDDYFYWISFMQLLSVTLQQNFFNAQNADYYMLRLTSGMNNPDPDWELFCTACPTYFRLWTQDIVANGLGHFAFDVAGSTPQGTLDALGAKGIISSSVIKLVSIELPLDPTWEVRGIRVYLLRVNGAGDPIDDALLVRWRPTANSDVGFVSTSLSGGIGNGNVVNCGDFITPNEASGFQQLFIQARVHRTDATSEIYIQKVEVSFSIDHFKPTATISDDENLCV